MHTEVWPGVLKTIFDCNIRNYSIFYREGWLFSYDEYIGNDYEADMKKMATDPVIQQWWKICEPCQQPLESCQNGEWWAKMEEVFHY